MAFYNPRFDIIEILYDMIVITDERQRKELGNNLCLSDVERLERIAKVSREILDKRDAGGEI